VFSLWDVFLRAAVARRYTLASDGGVAQKNGTDIADEPVTLEDYALGLLYAAHGALQRRLEIEDSFSRFPQPDSRLENRFAEAFRRAGGLQHTEIHASGNCFVGAVSISPTAAVESLVRG
jgi:hypothetical protein